MGFFAQKTCTFAGIIVQRVELRLKPALLQVLAHSAWNGAKGQHLYVHHRIRFTLYWGLCLVLSRCSPWFSSLLLLQ